MSDIRIVKPDSIQAYDKGKPQLVFLKFLKDSESLNRSHFCLYFSTLTQKENFKKNVFKKFMKNLLKSK